MKSFTRIVLPILLVAGGVFGITFVQLYSSDDSMPTDGDIGGMGKAKAGVAPLKFFTLAAIVSTPESTPKHLRYWDANSEVGASGHYEFWCQNRHEQPVNVRVHETNCQCAGVEMAIVPPAVFGDYTIGSALAGGPFCPAAGPAAALVHLALYSKLNWLPMHTSEGKTEQTIPPADAKSGPQFALVRLGWSGKGDPGPKTISAHLFANLPNATPAHSQLEAHTIVVPAFDVLRRKDQHDWVPNRELLVGDLYEKGEARHIVYLLSATRSQMIYDFVNENFGPCVSWTEPVPANEEEMTSVRAWTQTPESPVKQVRSMYRMEITVRERAEVESGGKKEVRYLDLGPLDGRLVVQAANAGSWPLHIRGRVLGEITIIGNESGRLELGSFAKEQERTRDMVLLADRPGVNLSLVEAETTPNFLKVKLEPLKPTADGRNQWRLRVTIAKGTLFGALPENASVVLKSDGPSARRLRIPIRGATFDSGGPRL